MNTKTAFVLAAVPFLFAIAPANASTFTFNQNDLGGNEYVGNNKNITTTFDDVSNKFSWSSTFSRNASSGLLAEGGWLVISDGENPKNNADEYAIFYLDGLNKKVSIYNYDGVNGSDSYKHETYLGSTALNVIDNGSDRTFKFSLNATNLNTDHRFTQPDWDGVAFGDKVGIWFHGAQGLTTQYDAQGKLKTFEYANQGWYDTNDQDTTKVPEPGSVAAIGLFAAAATVLRKRLASA